MVQTRYQEAHQTDMDAMWANFIKTKVNSFIKWDLVRFFHNNPYAVETADNIARFIARDIATVKYELDELSRLGVVEATVKSKSVVYRFTGSSELREQVDDFIKACHNYDFRVQAINAIINSRKF